MAKKIEIWTKTGEKYEFISDDAEDIKWYEDLPFSSEPVIRSRTTDIEDDQ